mgnify:FL=1
MGKRVPHKWNKVKPGDIISFKYKSIRTREAKMHTIIVLNPRLFVPLKEGGQTRQLIGIKLKEYQKIKLRLNAMKIKLFGRIGEWEEIDKENELYRLNIKPGLVLNDIKGTKNQAWKRLSINDDIVSQYRTYDWKQARKGAVYLEPVRMFGKIPEPDEALTQVKKPAEPKKVEKPKKPKKK